MKTKLLWAMALAVLTGCASASTGTSRDRSVLTREEIVDANELNALDLVRAYRPHWLRIRGSTSFTNEPAIVVYIDGVRAGEPDMLADIATINIEELRYYDARQAQFKFGVGHVQGAIEVITRR
jgi:hypothetical protein